MESQRHLSSIRQPGDRQLRTRTTRWRGVTAAVVAIGALFTVQAVRADAPASNPAESGVESLALAGGARFHPIAPYRAYDSRDPGCKLGGFLSKGENRIVDLATDDSCDLIITTEDVVAISYNLTVDQTVLGGFLAMYPAGGSWSGTSAVNWSSSGSTVGNGGIVQTGEAFEGFGFAIVEAGGLDGSGTHYVIDVTGYFASI